MVLTVTAKARERKSATKADRLTHFILSANGIFRRDTRDCSIVCCKRYNTRLVFTGAS